MKYLYPLDRIVNRLFSSNENQSETFEPELWVKDDNNTQIVFESSDKGDALYVQAPGMGATRMKLDTNNQVQICKLLQRRLREKDNDFINKYLNDF